MDKSNKSFVNMLTRRIFSFIIVMVLGVIEAMSQSYYHDSSVMNQFTVMETGLGRLTPPGYYSLFHKQYSATALLKSKLARRETFKMKVKKEVVYSDSIKSDLTKRAKVEDMTLVSRNPDLDVAWQLEGEKIGAKMNTLYSNIGKIMLVHPDPSVSIGIKDDWVLRYKCLQNDIEILRKSWLTMGDRQSQYLKLYKRILSAISELNGCLYDWNAIRKAKASMKAGGDMKRHSANANVAFGCLTRWSKNLGAHGMSTGK